MLNEEQIQTFLKAIEGDELWGDFFYLELMTGLRLCEICGLKWSDYDVNEGKLKVNRTLHSYGTTGDTKTFNGVRTILLPGSAHEMLKKRRENTVSE